MISLQISRGALAAAGAVSAFFWVILPVVGWYSFIRLENTYYPPPDLEPVKHTVSGLILLGGSYDRPSTAARGDIVYSFSGGRLFGFIQLALKYPQVPVIFTGGGPDLDLYPSEATLTEPLFRAWGIYLNDRMVVMENRSRNTYENALFTYNLVKPGEDQVYVLVTSAFHLPRATRLFRGIGWKVIPYAVDFHSSGKFEWKTALTQALKGLWLLKVVMHENNLRVHVTQLLGKSCKG